MGSQRPWAWQGELDKKEVENEKTTIALVGIETPYTSRSSGRTSSFKKGKSKEEMALVIYEEI